jgi:hypothetical protein
MPASLRHCAHHLLHTGRNIRGRFAESACVHGRLRRCAKDGISASEESWMQQDLGSAAAEELESMQLRSQSGANTR